jgi:4-amino-4-deoxy-L-arabinose transferase-like glycosyltransferase
VRQGLSRLWPVLVLTLFCLPLFVGLGRTDLQNDESIYSFAVDRILETGEWLTPRSSPDEAAPFLEKPPLKFWIVAASIRAGLLPHDEFGLRFWDAAFGGAAFLYVFLIGARLAGPACGLIAVVVLFVHGPLMFEHGLRSNNMEAALLLAYCGGIYHFLEWTRRPRPSSSMAVALFFVLGFMTKFVAALFLPAILALSVLMVPAWRRDVLRSWRTWAGAVAVALCLILPWFVYEHLCFGSQFWRVLFGEHVFRRMTVSIDPGHVHPWTYYFVLLHVALLNSGTLGLALVGAAVLLICAVRRRRGELILILLWFAVPMVLISASPSKIYHYAYPFLPALALAAGYGPAVLARALQPLAVGAGVSADRSLSYYVPRVTGAFRSPAVRSALLATAGGALALAALASIAIPVRWKVGGIVLLRNTVVLRPWLVAFLLATLAGRSGLATRLLVPLVILSAMPAIPYRATLARLPSAHQPLRNARDCVLGVIRGGPLPGVYAQIMEGTFQHSYYYYFRRFGAWEWTHEPDDTALYANVWGSGARRPVLVSDQRYREFREHLRTADDATLDSFARAAGVPRGGVSPNMADRSAPMIGFANVLLVLPGRYSACSADARATAVR